LFDWLIAGLGKNYSTDYHHRLKPGPARPISLKTGGKVTHGPGEKPLGFGSRFG